MTDAFTQNQIMAAEAAVIAIAQADINKEVPAMFQSMVPQSFVDQFAVDAVKAVIKALTTTPAP